MIRHLLLVSICISVLNFGCHKMNSSGSKELLDTTASTKVDESKDSPLEKLVFDNALCGHAIYYSKPQIAPLKNGNKNLVGANESEFIYLNINLKKATLSTLSLGGDSKEAVIFSSDDPNTVLHLKSLGLGEGKISPDTTWTLTDDIKKHSLTVGKRIDSTQLKTYNISLPKLKSTDIALKHSYTDVTSIKTSLSYLSSQSITNEGRIVLKAEYRIDITTKKPSSSNSTPTDYYSPSTVAESSATPASIPKYTTEIINEEATLFFIYDFNGTKFKLIQIVDESDLEQISPNGQDRIYSKASQIEKKYARRALNALGYRHFSSSVERVYVNGIEIFGPDNENYFKDNNSTYYATFSSSGEFVLIREYIADKNTHESKIARTFIWDVKNSKFIYDIPVIYSNAFYLDYFRENETMLIFNEDTAEILASRVMHDACDPSIPPFPNLGENFRLENLSEFDNLLLCQTNKSDRDYVKRRGNLLIEESRLIKDVEALLAADKSIFLNNKQKLVHILSNPSIRKVLPATTKQLLLKLFSFDRSFYSILSQRYQSGFSLPKNSTLQCADTHNHTTKINPAEALEFARDLNNQKIFWYNEIPWVSLFPLSNSLKTLPSEEKAKLYKKTYQKAALVANRERKLNSVFNSKIVKFTKQSIKKLFGMKSLHFTDTSVVQEFDGSLGIIVMGTDPLVPSESDSVKLRSFLGIHYYYKPLYTPTYITENAALLDQTNDSTITNNGSTTSPKISQPPEEASITWSMSGKSYVANIEFHTTPSGEILNISNSPKYEEWAKDGATTGMILTSSNFGQEKSKKIAGQYKIFYAANGFVFGEPTKTDAKSYLSKMIKSGQLDFFIKDAHSHGDDHVFMEISEEIIVIKGVRSTAFGVDEIIIGFPSDTNMTSNPIFLSDLNDWFDGRSKNQVNTEFLYLNSACGSSTLAKNELAIVASPNFKVIASSGTSTSFSISDSNSKSKILLGLLNRADYMTMHSELKLTPSFTNKSYNDFIFPYEERYLETYKPSNGLFIGSMTQVFNDDGSLYRLSEHTD